MMVSLYERFSKNMNSIMEHLEKIYMVTHMDQHGAITYTNQKFLEISHWTPKRILGKTFWQMFSDDEKSQSEASQIWSHLLTHKPWSGPVKKETRTGHPYYVEMTAVPILNDAKKIISVVTFERDITTAIQTKNQLQKTAFIDFETGLMNRHSLETKTNQFIDRKESFSFVYITIDRFYALQDFHSNESRTEIIQAVTKRLKRYFQNSDIARIGVNEFVIITQFGEWFIKGFNDFLKRHPIHIQNSTVTITVSGGIIRYPEHQTTYTNILAAAMTATRQASELGGENISGLSPDSHKALDRKSLIIKKLPKAIEEEQLQVVYQPQFDCHKNEIILYEALIRWEDDTLGTISPDELIPIAEENGFIQKIGSFVLAHAAQLASQLNRLGKPTKIAVNTSVREFISESRNNQILGILQRHSCPADLIQLEITETFAFQAEVESSIVGQMRKLKDEGIQFALDDFGTGFGSFRYMNSLPISVVKIDQEFIDSLTTHLQTKKLVNGMIQFAKSMDMFVVAEGVETKEQQLLLEELGIDAVQGYFIGEPITEEMVLRSFQD